MNLNEKSKLKNNKFPKYAIMSHHECAVILYEIVKDKATYYRPAGHWYTKCKVDPSGELLFTQPIPNGFARTYNIKGKETTFEHYRENNEGYL